MKILVINSSHRGSSSKTGFLVQLLSEGVIKSGAEWEEVDLNRMKINRCIGCFHCQSDAHPNQCVFDGKDDVRSIFEKIKRADVVVYATPIYIFSMASLLKTFLERMMATSDCDDLCASNSGLLFHAIDHEICSKPFVPLICCDNLEEATPANVIDYFRTYSLFMDAPQVGLLVRNGAKLLDNDIFVGSSLMIRKFMEIQSAFVKAGYELGSEGKISRTTMRTANQDFIPVPVFSLLKRIRSRRLKMIFAEKARGLQM